jgi:hypothetical protein
VFKIGIQSLGYLISGGYMGAIVILHKGYCIFPISFNNSMMKERGISISLCCPIFLCSLKMKFLIVE